MSACLRGVFAVLASLAFAVVLIFGASPPAAHAAPAGRLVLDTVADWPGDAVLTAQQNRRISAPRPSGRSFSAPRSPAGRSFSGARSTGARSFTGNRSVGSRSFSAGRSFGNRTMGTRSFGNRSFGTRTTGTRTFGNRSFGTRTTGTRTFGNRSFGTRTTGTRTFGNRSFGNRTTGTRTFGTRTFGNRTFGNRTIGTRTFGTRIGAGPGGRVGIAGIGPGGRVGIGRGPGFGGRNFARINNRQINVFRDRRRIWIGGIMRTIVPIAALTGLYVGSQYYYPDGYVPVARPRCSGMTEDGCSLRWQDVPLEGGGVDMQCVQFCPRVGIAAVPPPVPTAVVNVPPPVAGPTVTGALPPAAADAQATNGCELTIFSDANFAGMSAPTSEDQPRLVDAGWKNEIASVQVKSGTWDFYAEDDFGGEAMRLAPGTYADLGQWSRKVGSFMCSQP